MNDAEQPEALRLADLLDRRCLAVPIVEQATAELRRLHALCEEQKRLLEQARDSFNPVLSGFDEVGADGWSRADVHESDLLKASNAHEAITNHLRQHEGEKHD